MDHYRAALRLQPGFVETRLNMAVAQAVKQRPDTGTPAPRMVVISPHPGGPRDS